MAELAVVVPDQQTLSAPSAAPSKRPRLQHIDAVRGFVMALMVLDHVRAFFHQKAALFEPTDLFQSTAGLFMTRWVTHLCAPIFVLLAGSAAFLSQSRGREPGELARFLRIRGLWLIAVELTVVRFAWTFSFDYHSVVGQVIWAIGWSMILLSFLVNQPAKRVLTAGAVLIVVCGLLETVSARALGAVGPVWAVLISGETFKFADGFRFASKYPILPWAGLMLVGYGIGPVFLQERHERRRRLFWGAALTAAAFVALRWIELGAWRSVIYTGPAWGLLWLLDASKYPPSLTFMLMTVSPGLLLLALCDRKGGDGREGPLTVIGRVPFFFYIGHLFVIHAMAVVAESADRPNPILYPMNDWHYSLPWVYAIWIAVLLLMYPACRWFADLKKRRRDPWLSFL